MRLILLMTAVALASFLPLDLVIAAPAAGGVAASDIGRTALILTILAIIPAILVSMTSFMRIVIVLAMVRHAFGMPETPPNAVLLSLSLFLTAFIMSPTLTTINQQALQPMLAGTIGAEKAIETGSAPLRDFMLSQTRDQDIESIYAISKTPLPERPEQVEILKLAPAFILNELRVAFTIGFIILLPFLLIDLVVASILLSLGMMMVPPTTISLPIKLLMFVLIDGWRLVLEGVMGSFH
jgi:flagellar biosynthetic protein FliP